MGKEIRKRLGSTLAWIGSEKKYWGRPCPKNTQPKEASGGSQEKGIILGDFQGRGKDSGSPEKEAQKMGRGEGDHRGEGEQNLREERCTQNANRELPSRNVIAKRKKKV